MPNPFAPTRFVSRRLAVLGALGWLALTGCGEADATSVDSTVDTGEGASAETANGGSETSTGEGTETSSESEAVGEAAADMVRGESLFSKPQPWTKNVYNQQKSPSSDRIIQWLDGNGGWGTHKLRIEFGIKVLTADASTPFRSFTPTDEFYSPDCDHVPFPLPRGGSLEEENGYTCTTDGDCHLIVFHPGQRKLYEMWRANVTDKGFFGGCGVVWNLDKSYQQGRGPSCTSADAGGFPIAPMLFTADEVASGHIDHALRFVLPNNRIRRGVYVWPATHASDVLHGGPDAPPYGVRMRLRRDFPLQSLPTEGARVVARALQRYGMILADGGRVPLTAADDTFTQHKWDQVGVGPDSLAGLRVGDMEVVDLGQPIKNTGDCERN